MMRTGTPHSLRKHIITEHLYKTRGAFNGEVKLDFIAKSEKLRRSYLPRSYIKYNSVPLRLKQTANIKYLSKEVKAYLMSNRAISPPRPSQLSSPISTQNINSPIARLTTAHPTRPPPEPD